MVGPQAAVSLMHTVGETAAIAPGADRTDRGDQCRLYVCVWGSLATCSEGGGGGHRRRRVFVWEEGRLPVITRYAKFASTLPAWSLGNKLFIHFRGKVKKTVLVKWSYQKERMILLLHFINQPTHSVGNTPVHVASSHTLRHTV